MNFTWSPAQEAPAFRITPAGWARLVLRGSAVLAILLGGVVSMALLRLVEQPVHGLARPWTPHITQIVCRLILLVIGLRREAEGRPMNERGAVVANHASWLDILVLNAGMRVCFVSKSEVARWPGIGFLARMVGTVFIDRDPRQAREQKEHFEQSLLAGQKLLFFPEGTSTDGFRVLPFKSTLFQAFFNPRLKPEMHIQPVTVISHAPPGEDPRFYGWWGDMDFGAHLARVLAVRRQGKVRVICHPPVRVADFPDRKSLAAHLEAVVRSGMPPERQRAG